MSAALPRAGSEVYDSANRPHPFVEELLELYRYRDLVKLWSERNLTLRYKRSVLGVLWTLIEPLVLMIVLTIVFSAVFRFSLVNYPVYLLSGLIAFDFLNRSTMQMVDEIIASQNLAQRIHVPRSAFAAASVVSYLMNWGLALVPLLGIMLVLRHPMSWSLLAVPLSMLLLALFALGLGLIVATFGAFFHDIKLTYSVLLNAWFYATPIIYPMEIVPERLVPLFQLNPLYSLIGLFRAQVYYGEFGSWQTWLVSAVFALGLAALGWWTFTHWRRAFEYHA